MSKTVDSASFQFKWPWWRILVIVLVALALILSIILSWHHIMGGSMAGCGTGSSCDQVLSSRWSTIAGVLPISGIAVGTYLAMLILCFFIDTEIELPVRRLAWKVLVLLVGTIAGGAIWFTILQYWIIGDFCVYCMTTHAIGIILTVLIIRQALKEKEINPDNTTQNRASKNKIHSQASTTPLVKPARILGLVLLGMCSVGIMAVSQFQHAPSAIANEEAPQVTLPELDYNHVPLVGSPNAPYIVTLLFDYQCSHCQKIHFMLREVVNQYEGKLAFALCPAPLENSCNPFISPKKTSFRNSCELAKIGLSVWRTNPEAFASFENWMFTFDAGNAWRPRNLETVKAKAVELIGQNALDSAMDDPWVEQYIQNGVRMFGQTLQNGRGGIPKMIYGSKWIIPEPYNADDLVTILQKSLGVPKH